MVRDPFPRPVVIRPVVPTRPEPRRRIFDIHDREPIRDEIHHRPARLPLPPHSIEADRPGGVEQGAGVLVPALFGHLGPKHPALGLVAPGTVALFHGVKGPPHGRARQGEEEESDRPPDGPDSLLPRLVMFLAGGDVIPDRRVFAPGQEMRRFPEEAGAFFQIKAFGEQQVGAVPGIRPAFQRLFHPGADAEELPIVPHPIRHAIPFPQERLVSQRNSRSVRGEEPGRDEGIDEGGFLRRVFERGEVGATADIGVRFHSDQGVEDLRTGFLLGLGEFGEFLVRTLGQGAFQAGALLVPERFVGVEGDDVFLGAELVKFQEEVGEEREHVRLALGVFEDFADKALAAQAGIAFLEPQARSPGRFGDDAPESFRAGSEEIELAALPFEPEEDLVLLGHG